MLSVAQVREEGLVRGSPKQGSMVQGGKLDYVGGPDTSYGMGKHTVLARALGEPNRSRKADRSGEGV